MSKTKKISKTTKKNQPDDRKSSSESASSPLSLSVLAASLLLLAVVGAGIWILFHTFQKENEPTDSQTTGSDTTSSTVYLETDGYDFDAADYLNIPDLKSITISEKEIEQAWEDVALSIRLNYADYQSAEEEYTAVLYDKLTITYVGYGVDSPLSDEMSQALCETSGEDIVIGSGELIATYENASDASLSTKGFEEQLIGAKKGDQLQILVTFPDDYTDSSLDCTDLQGQRVLFEVIVQEVYAGTVPELTDALIVKYTSSQYSSVQEYQDFVCDYYRSVLSCSAIFDALTVSSYPTDERNEAAVNYLYSIASDLYGSSSSLTEDQVAELYNQYADEAYAYAEEAVGERLKLEYLFDLCQITLTQSEYEQYLQSDYSSNYLNYYIYYGIASQNDLESTMGKSNLILQYMYEKLLDQTADLITFTS
jgi:hypothetical protein